MNKRSNTECSNEQFQDVSGDESQSSTVFVSRKRRRLANASQLDLCQEIFDGVRSYRGDEGSLCETFMRLPPKRSNAEYYEAIKEPMDLARIQARIKSEHYKNVDDMAADVNLLVANTKSFYPSSTKEFSRAVELEEVFNKERDKVLSLATGSNASTTSSVSSRATRRRSNLGSTTKREETDDDEIESASMAASEDSHIAVSETSTTNMTSSSQRSSGTWDNPFELFFASIAKYAGEDGRALSKTFTYLPSKKAYPIYYTVIQEPIDLRMIARRIQSGSYASLDDLEKDFALMARNAKSFNEPKSLIYQDAITLNRILKGKRSEAEHPPVRTNRERGKRTSRLNYNPHDVVEEYAVLPDEQPTLKQTEPDSETPFFAPEDDDTQATENTSQSLSSLPSSTEKRKRGRPPKVHSTVPSSPSVSRDSFTASSPLRLSSPLPQSPGSPSLDATHVAGDSSVLHPHIAGQYTSVCRYRVGTVRWRVAQVLQAVLDAHADDGHLMCTPFLRLPSRKIYPDYYQEITNPLSLADMKKKLKANAYPTLNSVMADLDLVFKNAQQYNVEESVIYKDSLILQEVARKRYQEMVNYQPTYTRRAQFSLQTTAETPGAHSSISDQVHCSSVRESPLKRLHKRILTADEAKAKRLRNVFNTVFSYVAEDGHRPRDVFLHLPSKEDYPDYYDVIPEPIDLTMIRKKMDQNEYAAHQEMVADLRLMFNNARHYNEEGSSVYNDAVILEKVLKRRLKSLGPYQGNPFKRELMLRGGPDTVLTSQSATDYQVPANVVAPPNTCPPGSQPGLPLLQRVILELFQTVREYQVQGRQLSTHFMRLPTRAELPTYYEFIKKPIELQTIAKQVLQMRYTDFEDFVSDLFLMFDNACRFNEPTSQIYADSLTLLRVCLAKRAMILNTFAAHLGIPPCVAPDVSTGVRRLLTNLHNSMLTACDADGRGLVDSLIAGDGTESTLTSVTAARLAALHRAVAAGAYRRLDRLQADWLEILKRARIGEGEDQPSEAKNPLPTLQQRVDAADLARRWVRLRDEICHRTQRRLPLPSGASSQSTPGVDCSSALPSHLTLLSPAVSYTTAVLDRELQEEEEKYKLTSPGDEHGEATLPELGSDEVELPHIQIQNEVFHVGDFVYIGPVQSEITQCPIGRIIRICNRPTDSQVDAKGNAERSGNANLSASLVTVARYFRPSEARPSRRRRLISSEVFRTALCQTVAPDKLVGHCLVMHITQFIRYRPKNIEERNLFVCESQFSVASQTFLKIQHWDIPIPLGLDLEQRPVAFVPTRLPPSEPLENALQQVTATIFKHMVFPLPRTYQSVVLNEARETEGDIVYEQYVHENGFLVKLGDFLYVPALTGPCDRHIVRVDKLWRSASQNAILFSGPWFVLPAAVEHLPTYVLFPKEVFMTDAEVATHALASATGKCFVMRFVDYCQARPTDYQEQDVYLCDSKFYETEKVIHKLKKALKRFELSGASYEDEFFFFPQPICPRKEASPLLNQTSIEPLIQEQLNRPISTAVNCAVAASVATNDVTQSALAASSSAPTVPIQPPIADAIPCESSMPVASKDVPAPKVPHSISSPSNTGQVLDTDDACFLDITTDRSRKKRKLRKPPSGYVIYAGEVRKRLLQERRDAPFGEISREVGLLWRQMPSSQRDFYERKAKLIKRRMEEEEMRAKAREQELSRMQQQHSVTPMPVDVTHTMSVMQSQTVPLTLSGYATPTQTHATAMPYQPSTSHMTLGGPPPMQFYQSPSGQVFQILHTQSSASAAPTVSCHPINSVIPFNQPTFAAVSSGCAVPTGTHQVIYQLPGHAAPMVSSNSLGSYVPQSGYYPQQRVLVASNVNQPTANPLTAMIGSSGQSNMALPSVSTTHLVLGTSTTSSLHAVPSSPHPAFMQPNISLVPNVHNIPLLTNSGLPQEALASAQSQVNLAQPNSAQATQLVSGAPPNVQLSVPTTLNAQPHTRAQSPFFVSAPPRTSRVLHSEIYQRYISRLQKNVTGGLSDWRNQLSATGETAVTPSGANPNLIASNFLANPQNHAHHGSVTEALWSLRDHLLEDALKIRLRVLSTVEC